MGKVIPALTAWTIIRLRESDRCLPGEELGFAAAGAATDVDLSGGTNAAKSTWTGPALTAEGVIVANGGSVLSNP